jgi:hypothetical protein
MSDSSYAASTRHRKPYSTGGRPHELDRIDDAWAASDLSDDEVDVHRHELAIAPLLDEGDLDIDAVVISNGQMGSAFTTAFERRRRDGTKWADLAMDQYQLDLKGKKDVMQSNSIHTETGRTQPAVASTESQSTTAEGEPDRSSETSTSSAMQR